MTDRLLPEFTMRSASAFTQISQLFVRDIDAWMNAHQLRPQSRLARPHQLDQRMLALEFAARGAFLFQLARVLGANWYLQNEYGERQQSRQKAPSDFGVRRLVAALDLERCALL